MVGQFFPFSIFNNMVAASVTHLIYVKTRVGISQLYTIQNCICRELKLYRRRGLQFPWHGDEICEMINVGKILVSLLLLSIFLSMVNTFTCV